ncbi:MAG: homoserine dehydrogenase, partial [Holdemanella sp.]|nr:homoserine dehydrogenase [Holdemanella sp.]
GYGTVGKSFYELCNERSDIACVKTLLSRRARPELDCIVTDSIDDIINDSEIDTVVEVMGGIHPAFEFITMCLESGKHVVTANKAVVAAHLNDFLKTAKQNNVQFLFEASTGGGIPWLASIRKARRIDEIKSVSGIFNGTSNFILDHMTKMSTSFEDALRLAQNLGYAEANPSADIDGYDVQNKIVISSALAYDTYIDINIFPTFPMRSVTFDDIKYFQSMGKTIKYMGESSVVNNEYEAFVMPNIVDNASVEANISTNFNITSLYGETIGQLKFYGQGAGMLPTANAIIQDILDIQNNVPYAPIQLNKGLTYSDTLSTSKYCIRTNQYNKVDEIEEIKEYNGKNYVFTKEITAKELKAVVEPILEKDPSAFVMKIRKG